MKKILVINTGSTSTKVAVFYDKECVLQSNLVMPEEELKHSVVAADQLPYRTKVVDGWLAENGYQITDFDMISCRGGSLPPVKGGAYKVNQLMVDVLKYAPASRHESSLSCMIGFNLAGETDIPVMIYDSINVDELQPVARYTGVPGLKNRPGGHVLNSRRVSKLVAERDGKDYYKSTYIVVHLGGSISVTAHEHGKIIDCVFAFTGPMSSQRAGRIQADQLIRMCYSGEYTEQQLLKKLNGESGFKGYFGTQDARKVSELLDAGNQLAKEVTEAMGYQTAKAIAEMRIAVNTPVDKIIFTGGMANFKYIIDYIVNRVRFIAPVEIIPGEYEMEALAEGAIHVLDGEEEAKEYDVLPKNFETKDEFYRFIEERNH